MPQTPADRLANLEAANETRCRRAQLKRDLKAGRAELAELIADTPDWLLNAPVWTFALCVPKYGRTKVAKIMRRVDVSPHRTFENLTRRQRTELIEAIAWA